MPSDQSVMKVRKQAEITAEDVIESLRGSINCGYMTYHELIGILMNYLQQSIDEMRLSRPESMCILPLEETGLKELYNVLEKLKPKLEKRKKK